MTTHDRHGVSDYLQLFVREVVQAYRKANTKFPHQSPFARRRKSHGDLQFPSQKVSTVENVSVRWCWYRLIYDMLPISIYVTHIHLLDRSHKSRYAPDKCPTMHQFVTEMCTHVHISVTNWCIVGYGSSLMWYLWNWSKQSTTKPYVHFIAYIICMTRDY